MANKKIMSFMLSLSLFAGNIISVGAYTDKEKTQRRAYLHAQGAKPSMSSSVDSSTVYEDDGIVDIYLAVDDPNKGDFADGEHKEPQYDLNGYSATIYFDGDYFDYKDINAPIDYTVPDADFSTSGKGEEDVGGGTVGDVPSSEGYYVRTNEAGEKTINGKTYKTATITVFFSGVYLNNKTDADSWYNLCKLPLVPIMTGSTKVFVDISGTEYETLTMYAKNKTTALKDQTFTTTARNGGYHTIVIKSRNNPAAPTADLPEGAYTDTQRVRLAAEAGCDIYYRKNDGAWIPYDDDEPIKIDMTTTVECYAVRNGKRSMTVSYTYRIIPNKPVLFADDGTGEKTAIRNNYNQVGDYWVYISDKVPYSEAIDADNTVYYTFGKFSEEDFEPTEDPNLGWVAVDPGNSESMKIHVEKNIAVRLITKKENRYSKEFSEVAEYALSIKPSAPTATPDKGEFKQKADVTLSAEPAEAVIYYTTDGTDPRMGANVYSTMLTFRKDTTLRAVAVLDGIYSDVRSYYYTVTEPDNFGVSAFYDTGTYEGSVNVTLTAYDPDNRIEYRLNDEEQWHDYEGSFTFDTDTVLWARAVNENSTGGEYQFTYTIRPKPPIFSPTTTQFVDSGEVFICCDESNRSNGEHYTLYYTTDGSDPRINGTEVEDESDSVTLTIDKYTVVKAVVYRDGTPSNVVTHSYDIVKMKPTKPVMTLSAGNYVRYIGDEEGYVTEFLPVVTGTELYYNISRDGSFLQDPIPNTAGTIPYDQKPIKVYGHTIIKAVAKNEFGAVSDVGTFEYIVSPEAPIAAPSATVSGDRLPVVPISAVTGSTVKYEINGQTNEVLCENGVFYIDAATGNAYSDKECRDMLGSALDLDCGTRAELKLSAVLDGIESVENVYRYSRSTSGATLAAPYADKTTGEYEEIRADDEDNLLYVSLASLNDGAAIEYKLDNEAGWRAYGETIKLKKDTVLQIRCEKDGLYSEVVSYVYNFVPLAPIITPVSGRYVKSDDLMVGIYYDSRAPKDKIENRVYERWFRANGDSKDGFFNSDSDKKKITKSMAFKAYVKNTDTGRVSKSAVNYYIIEKENARGSVSVAYPYTAEPYNSLKRINAALLGTDDYAKGIQLESTNKSATIYYSYSYHIKNDDTDYRVNTAEYANNPIMVNPMMTDMTITARLMDSEGSLIQDSEETFKFEFVHLNIPKTDLGETGEYARGSKYSIVNEYKDKGDVYVYYTIGTDNVADPQSEGELWDENNEPFELTAKTTIRICYMSVCGTCAKCKGDEPLNCLKKVYSEEGKYTYTVPTVQYTGGGGGGGHTTIDKTRKYTKDIFGTEHPTHISYINGYPDGGVRPEGKITREEMAAVLYRVTSHEYEKPFIAAGERFSDVNVERWSAHDVEYMADKTVIEGYPDGEFKPKNNLTRAEFAALICRFAGIEKSGYENPFVDLDDSHWAYNSILSLASAGYMEGYEDDTFRAESQISRAEVMTVVNKILGRNPSESYVKTLDFNPYTDLEKEKWYYTAVLEATVTHNYLLDNSGFEVLWEDCK